MMKPVSIQAVTSDGTYFARWYTQGYYENTVHLMKLGNAETRDNHMCNPTITLGIFRVKRWRSPEAQHQRSQFEQQSLLNAARQTRKTTR